MNRLNQRKVCAVAIVALAIGWWATHSESSPFVPDKPQDRPILKFIARVARLGLWLALAAEKPPAEVEQRQVVARFDENGNRVLNHEEGW